MTVLRCPYCRNDHPQLLETTDRGDLFCVVCSRVAWLRPAPVWAGHPALVEARRGTPETVTGVLVSGAPGGGRP